MPDRIELASSGRARCRACRKAIAKGQERFAEAAPNPLAEGETQYYYHLECAAERRPKLFSALYATLQPPRTDLEPLAAAAALATAHHRLERLGVIERAKSARANCRFCRELIEKEAWRVALQPIEEGRVGAWGFIHLACVTGYTGVKPSLERLLRYSELTDDARSEIDSALTAMVVPEPAAAGVAPADGSGRPEQAGDGSEQEPRAGADSSAGADGSPGADAKA